MEFLHIVKYLFFSDDILTIAPMPKEVEEGKVVVIKPPTKALPEERTSPWLGLVTSTKGNSIYFDWVVKKPDFGEYAVGIALEPKSAKTDISKILATFSNVHIPKLTEDTSFDEFVLKICFP